MCSGTSSSRARRRCSCGLGSSPCRASLISAMEPAAWRASPWHNAARPAPHPLHCPPPPLAPFLSRRRNPQGGFLPRPSGVAAPSLGGEASAGARRGGCQAALLLRVGRAVQRGEPAAELSRLPRVARAQVHPHVVLYASSCCPVIPLGASNIAGRRRGADHRLCQGMHRARRRTSHRLRLLHGCRSLVMPLSLSPCRHSAPPFCSLSLFT